MSMIKYYISANGTDWTDLTGTVDSRNTTITQNECSTSFTSAEDSASFSISPVETVARNAALTMIMSALENGTDVYAMVKDGSTTLCYGVVNLSGFSITSLSTPQPLTISIKDLASVYLDEKPTHFITMDGTGNTPLYASAVVKALLEDAECPYDDFSLGEDDYTLPGFVIDRDNADTYRSYIDKILLEAGLWHLNMNDSGKAVISHVPIGSATSSGVITDYIVSEGVQTSGTSRDEKGLEVKWTTWAKKANSALYVENISRDVTDAGGLRGTFMQKDSYFPSNGDVDLSSPVYQEYSVDFVDTAYKDGSSRQKNKDLSLIFAKDITRTIQVTDEDGETKSNTNEYIAYPNIITTEPSNPTIYPTKAFVLLQARKDCYLLHFSIRGTAIYRNRQYTTAIGEIKDPKEYTSQYIFKQSQAEKFCTRYFYTNKYSRMTHKWSSLSDIATGTVVTLKHKGTTYSQDAYIVSKTLKRVGDQWKYSYTAISIGAWNSSAASTWGATIEKSPVVDLTTTILAQYAWGDDETSAPTSGWSSTQPDNPNNYKYLWRRESVDSGETWKPAVIFFVSPDELGPDISIEASQTLIEYTPRKSASATVTFIATKVNIDSAIKWYVNDVQVKNSDGTDYTGTTYSLTVQLSLNKEYKVEVKAGAYIADVTISRFTNDAPMYIGMHDEDPTMASDTEGLMHGDWYCNKSDKMKVYRCSIDNDTAAVTWTLVTSDDPDWAEMAQYVTGDADFDVNADIEEMSIVDLYVRNLVANKASIRNLTVQELKSNNFSNDSSNKWSTSGFEISSSKKKARLEEVYINTLNSKGINVFDEDGNELIANVSPAQTGDTKSYSFGPDAYCIADMVTGLEVNEMDLVKVTDSRSRTMYINNTDSAKSPQRGNVSGYIRYDNVYDQDLERRYESSSIPSFSGKVKFELWNRTYAYKHVYVICGNNIESVSASYSEYEYRIKNPTTVGSFTVGSSWDSHGEITLDIASTIGRYRYFAISLGNSETGLGDAARYSITYYMNEIPAMNYFTLADSTRKSLYEYYMASDPMTITYNGDAISSSGYINHIADKSVYDTIGLSKGKAIRNGVYKANGISYSFSTLSATSSGISFGNYSFSVGSYHRLSSFTVSYTLSSKDAGYWTVNMFANNMIGMVQEMYCTTVPIGWIECKGQQIDSGSNPRLYAYLLGQGLGDTLPNLTASRTGNYHVCIYAGE